MVTTEAARLARLRLHVPIAYVHVPDVYMCGAHVAADVRQHGRVLVFTGGTEPLWDRRLNFTARAEHDLIHAALNAPFTMDGEYAVYRYLCSLRPQLEPLYRAEILDQAAAYLATGEFPPQRAP